MQQRYVSDPLDDLLQRSGLSPAKIDEALEGLAAAWQPTILKPGHPYLHQVRDRVGIDVVAIARRISAPACRNRAIQGWEVGVELSRAQSHRVHVRVPGQHTAHTRVQAHRTSAARGGHPDAGIGQRDNREHIARARRLADCRSNAGVAPVLTVLQAPPFPLGVPGHSTCP